MSEMLTAEPMAPGPADGASATAARWYSVGHCG